MATRFPVVTGVGIVTAAGCGVDEVWHSIARGESGLRPLTLFKSSRYGQILAGEILDGSTVKVDVKDGALTLRAS